MMRPLSLLFAVVGVSLATAARVALSAQLRGQAHSLRLRLSNLEEEVRRQGRHANGAHHMHTQWDEAEEEMSKLRRQVESTEEEARKSLELPEKSSVDRISAPSDAEGAMISAPSDSQGATKGELRAVEAKLENQQAQIDHLESMVDRLVSASLSSEAQNSSHASAQGPGTDMVQDMESASQEASDNLAKEIATDQGQGGLLTEDEVQQEDKDYHTPAPHVNAPAAAAVTADETEAEHAELGRTEDTWQDFLDPGDDAEEADGLENAPVAPANVATASDHGDDAEDADGLEEKAVSPVKDVLNMAKGNLQPLAPAEVKELEIPVSHTQHVERTSDGQTEKDEQADEDVEAEMGDDDGGESSPSESAELVPLQKVDDEPAEIEEHSSKEAALPAFDDVDEEDTVEITKEIPMARSKGSASAKGGSLDNAEQLLKDDGSAEVLSPAAMGHVLADASMARPGAVTLAAPSRPRKQVTMVRPAGAPVPLFFAPPPEGMQASAPA